MKISKLLIAVFFTTFSSMALAHCPASFKAEKVCFMLDKNMVYIWDHKFEHNGPYKDFKKAELTEFKSEKGDILPFKKIARGIYKLDATEIQKTITIVATLDKKKNEIKVSNE